MKKLIHAITAIVFAASAAHADTSCFKKSQSNSRDFDYHVLFLHDKDEIEDWQCLTSLKAELNRIEVGNCQLILLIGSADTKGSQSYNTDLAKRRVQYVAGLFNEPLQPKLLLYTGGDSNAYNYTPDETSYPDERAVRIMVKTSNVCNIEPEQEDNQEPENKASGSKVSAGARRQIASRISNSYSELEKLSNGFKVSKWKNEDGKFNGARLVSDSVAGVVLGTAGGLITSSVIKKNQVEDGFEDINCVVGGQVVAGWKDQFNVGVQ